MEISVYQLEFYKYLKSFNGEVSRIDDNFRCYILATSVEDAVSVLQSETGGLSEIFSYSRLCGVDRISGSVVSKVISDNGHQYIKDVMNSQNMADKQISSGLQKQRWRNASTI